MKKTRFLVLAIVALHSFAAELRAQLEWDTDPLTPGIQGGTGNWLTANLWNNGTSNVSWINGSIATFSGTAGTVTVNGALTANGLTFLSNGYTIDGASILTLGGAAPAISIPTAGVSATISAPLGGSAGLTKTGAGTLVLTGANSFTGNLAIDGGTVSVNDVADSGVACPLGAGTSLSLNGGTLSFNSAATDSTNRSIVLGANGGTFNSTNASQNLTLAGVISGSGGLTKTGTGALRLTNTNTFTGNVTMTAAYIEVPSVTNSGVAGPLGAGSSISISGGGLIIPGFNTNTTNRSISIGLFGATFGPGNGTLTLAGVISGNGTLSTTSNGVVILTAANTHTGNIFISSGIVRVANGQAIGDASEVFLGGFANPPKILDLNNSNETIGSLRGGDSTGGNVTLGSGTLTIGGDNSSKVYDGAISGTGSVVKIGTGTQTLNGASTFTGPITINGGVISVADLTDSGVTGPLGAGASVVFGGGTLEFAGLVNDSTNRPIVLNAGGGTISVQNVGATVTISGAISGSGSLTKAGPAGLSLTAVNTFSGPFVVNGGTVSVNGLAGSGSPSAIGTGSSIVLNNGALLYSGTGTFSTNRSVTLTGGGTLGPGNGSIQYSGAISGNGTLGITGPGLLILSGVNTYAGNTSIVNTIVRLANGNAIPNTSEVFISGNINAVLDLNNSSETIGALSGGNDTGGNVTLGTGTLTTGGNDLSTTYDGVISGSGGFVKIGAGTQTLSRVNTFSGSFSIQNGAVSTPSVTNSGLNSPLGSGNSILMGATGTTGSLNFTSASDSATDRAIQLNGNGGSVSVVQAASTLFFNGPITGAGGLTKSGPGTLSVSGTPAYTGATTISQGKLILNGGLDTAGGGIAVATGATLQTRNTVNRSIIGTGAIIASGGLSIGSSTSTTGFAFDGTLDVGTNQVVLNDANTAQLGTATTLGSGGRLNSVNGITVASGRTVTASPTVSATISGTLVNNGLITGPISAGQTLTLSNNVSGTGNYGGNILFSANFSPGNNGPAAIALDSFNFLNTTTLALEIGGLTPGTQYDRLNFTGTGVLDGKLTITLTGGFQPLQGHSFTIISDGTLSGGFDDMTLPGLAPGLAWFYSQTPTSAVLLVVPEPGTVALLPAALCLLTLRRRCRAAVPST
jgi:autotransporter-associated beta strand protein